MQAEVNDHKDQLVKLKDKVMEDSKTIKQLRALLLERDVTIKHLTDQLGNEVGYGMIYCSLVITIVLLF